MGSMKYLAFGLLEVEVGDLKAMADFHGGGFTAAAVKSKLLNMSAQRNCHAFAAARKSDNRIKNSTLSGIICSTTGCRNYVS